MIVFRFIADIWMSLLVSVLVAIGGFLTMGLLGLVVYHLVSPILNMWYPPLGAWDQSSVWPAIIMMPVMWSPAFVLAGIANRQTKRRGWTRKTRVILYVAIIYAAAVLAWSIVLNTNPTLWR